MTEPQDFLEYLVKGIVDNPNDVSVTKTVDDIGTLLTLTVMMELLIPQFFTLNQGITSVTLLKQMDTQVN
jgi:hypothetical protein